MTRPAAPGRPAASTEAAPARAALPPAAPAEAPPPDGTVETPRLRSGLRRSVFWVVAAVAALAFAVVSVLLTSSAVPDADRYSIGNAGPSGGRAVAEVLRQQGVDVVAASSLAEARAAADSAGGDATVLFSDPYGYLEGDKLAEVALLGTRLVLLEPGATELDEFAPGVRNAGSADETDPVAAACALPAAERASEISRPTATYRLVGGSDAVDDALTCFPSYDDAFGVITLDTDDGVVTVFGAGDALTNEYAPQYGNAALALGVLGENPTLVWYQPGYDDLEGGAPETLGSLTPDWVTPVMLLLIVVVIAAGIWRGRRFGPVVVENLPVTVRASETMEGRARLYAKQAAHGRALDALRIGTVSRLATLLNLPRHATVVEVSRAVAAVTGRHPDEVHAVLVGAVPNNEAELLQLSDRLLALEQEVTRATRLL
ncbi:DUF4350 domain-containing protein [Herbiconiux sp. KACC 21604]|uniref:DUF4350 domain-containing protein n=1 Tax=unclassified Herbiconiux TaxID=2618217 RepID=UPI001492760B|nr:DUF4350 domain-containing protein [Herbiconiux sp. SALV-R1]QJU54397.1 DUF4350 domain-containing protein [Herbiconiux sp. SALV-R1]WPO85471.1 DUF4350 domain-containing protein [Herbiconiux sp. KACC 21604]